MFFTYPSLQRLLMQLYKGCDFDISTYSHTDLNTYNTTRWDVTVAEKNATAIHIQYGSKSFSRSTCRDLTYCSVAHFIFVLCCE